MITLTYKTNASEVLHAAYLGDVRVGYVERRLRSTSWIWWSSLIHPHGGCYSGRAASEEEGKEALADAVRHWVQSAGLVVRP